MPLDFGCNKELPQAMFVWWMLTSLEFCRCIPSVLRLFSGEDIVTSWTITPWQLSNLRWHCELLTIVMPATKTLKLPYNLNACIRLQNLIYHNFVSVRDNNARKIIDILTVGLICGILSSSTSYCRKVSKVNKHNQLFIRLIYWQSCTWWLVLTVSSSSSSSGSE